MLRPTAPIKEHHRPHFCAAALPSTGVTRRGMLAASLAMTGAGLAGVTTFAFGQSPGIRSTNEQILGPFYPVRKPADQDADLTIIAATTMLGIVFIELLLRSQPHEMGAQSIHSPTPPSPSVTTSLRRPFVHSRRRRA